MCISREWGPPGSGNTHICAIRMRISPEWGPPRSGNMHICAVKMRISREWSPFADLHIPPGSVFPLNGAHLHLGGPPRSGNTHIRVVRMRISAEKNPFACQNGAHLPFRGTPRSRNKHICAHLSSRDSYFSKIAYICWARADDLDTCSSHRRASPRRDSATRQWPGGLREA